MTCFVRRLVPVPLFCVSLLLGSHQLVQAGTVNWNSNVVGINKTSANANLDATYMFELGAFANGFIPNSGNTASWAANWVTADRTPYSVNVAPFVGTGKFQGTYEVNSNAAPFGTNQQGYIWGYKCTTSSTGEWILFTNTNWKWPAAGGIGLPVSWAASNATNSVIVGQINSGGAPFLMKTAAISGSPLPSVVPAAWKSTYFTAGELADPAISGWNADPDEDGTSNAFEYATGKHPRDASSSWRPVVAFETGTDGKRYLALSILLNRSAKVKVSAACCGDLSNWPLNPPTVTLNQVQQFSARDSVPMDQATRRFLRLAVTVQE